MLVVSQCWAERCVKKDICGPCVVYNPCIYKMNIVLIPTNVHWYFDVVLLQVIIQHVSGHLQGDTNKNSVTISKVADPLRRWK